jgi:minor extracellular serine protease Vpr
LISKFPFLCILVLYPLIIFAGMGKLGPRLSQVAQGAAELNSANHDFLRKSDAGLMVRAILTFNGDLQEIRDAGVQIVCHRGNIAVVDIPSTDLERVSNLPSVVYIEAPLPSRPLLDKSTVVINAVQARNQNGVTGKGVIVGIIDTGIDWTHYDFRKPDGSTRIRSMLDLSSPGSVYGGAVYTEAQINDALAGGAAVGMNDVSGHGTHVAGIAAGDGAVGAGFGVYAGVAPEADLVIVKAARDEAGREFLISDQIIALTFIDSIAQKLSEPYVANLSLGGHNGAHDGTSPVERFIDSIVGPGVAGKVVVTVAGNDGDKSVHAQTTLAGGGTQPVITFRVDGYVPNAGVNNDLINFDGWYDGTQKIGVSLIAPSGKIYGPVLPGNLYDKETADGVLYIWNGFYEEGDVYRAGVNVLNGDREFYVQISDDIAVRPSDGEWQMVFSGSGGTIDVWIANATMDVAFEQGSSETGKVSIPGTSRNALTVGAFVSKRSWFDLDGNNLTYDSANLIKVGQLAPFSSPGPVRKGGYLKPEITAPGQIIVSSLSRSAPADGFASIFNTGDSRYPNALINQDGLHALSSGTSVAAPHVTGSAALLLQQYPQSSAQQIKDMITSSARRDSYVGNFPNERWGWGKLDVLQALSAKPGDEIVNNFKLLPARPNPFPNQTAIFYQIPQLEVNQISEIVVFNALGQKVRTLLRESQNQGTHSVVWDGSNDAGLQTGSGVYFIQIKIGTWNAVEKVAYLGSK